MNYSTIKIINNDDDRVMRLDILDSIFLGFTVMRKRLVVIKAGDENILLYNRSFNDRDELSKAFDEIILNATKAKSSDEFISHMDTYIDISNMCDNDMINDAKRLCDIILKI